MRLKDLRLVSLPSAVYLAQEAGVNNPFFRDIIGPLFGGNLNSPAKAQNVGQLIVSVVEVLLLVAASIAVIFLVVGGYQYVVSRGNEEAAEKAKKTMGSSILGFVIIVLAFTIIRIISAILLGEGPGAGTGIGN